MIRLQSVKVRLTLWYALVLSVFLALFSFIMYAELSRALYHDVEKNLSWSALQTEESVKSKLVSVSAINQSASDPSALFTKDENAQIEKVVKDWDKTSDFKIKQFRLPFGSGMKNDYIGSLLKQTDMDHYFWVVDSRFIYS
jgi:hypothetical protein